MEKSVIWHLKKGEPKNYRILEELIEPLLTGDVISQKVIGLHCLNLLKIRCLDPILLS